MPNRREFLSAAMASLLSVPLAAEGQHAWKVPRVGFLSAQSASDPQAQRALDVFRQSLRELGYMEGQSVAIEYRWAEGKPERLPELATELVRLKVDVIVTAGGVPPAQAAQRATKEIPIVATGAVDPVAAGLVTSLARPGGNITGLAQISDQLVGKELELLKEVAPKVTRVAVLWNPTNPGNTHQLRGAEQAAAALELRLQPVEARSPGEIDRAFVAMMRERAEALLVLLDATFYDQRARIVDLAAKSRLPAVYGYSVFAETGGLMSYAANRFDVARYMAVYVNKILKGAKPGDLPVEQPTKFELIINLKTAKALRLAIPPSLLLRADQVIE
jgi:putative ABC transport system substrate-binding protein